MEIYRSPGAVYSDKERRAIREAQLAELAQMLQGGSLVRKEQVLRVPLSIANCRILLSCKADLSEIGRVHDNGYDFDLRLDDRSFIALVNKELEERDRGSENAREAEEMGG